MCRDNTPFLTFETLLNDPLTRMVMAADQVTVAELVEVLQIARGNVAAREHAAISRALAAPCATSARA